MNMTLNVEFFAHTAFFGSLVIGSGLFIWSKRHVNWLDLDFSNRTISFIAITWIAILTAEFWVAGEQSYVWGGDEGGQSFPFFIYLSNFFKGGRFDFDLAGGTDIYSAFSSGFQLISPERFLFSVFEPWAALAIHKICVSSVAFFSAYIFARRVGGVRKVLALAVGAVHTIIFEYQINITLAHGLGYAVMPLGVMVSTFMHRSRYYLFSMLIIAVVIAITTTPVQGGMQYYAAVITAALISGAWRYWQFYMGFLICISFQAINWVDHLYAWATFAEYSGRVTMFEQRLALEAIINIKHLLIPYGVMALCLGISWIFQRSMFAIGVCMALPILFAMIFQQMPWGSIGLDFMKGINPDYILYSSATLTILAMTKAFSSVPVNLVGGSQTLKKSNVIAFFAIFVLFSIPFAALLHYKTLNLAYWIGLAGQPKLVNIPNLQEFHPPRKEISRFVVVPHHLFDNNLLAHGLPTLGGYFQLLNKRMVEYWREIGAATKGGRMYLKLPKNLCRKSLQADKFIDVNFLRAANVGYIVSYIPIHGDDIIFISGPEPALFEPRCHQTFKKKLKIDLRDRATPKGAFVYKVRRPFPRIFFAKTAVYSERDFSSPMFWDEVRAEIKNYGIVWKNDHRVGGAEPDQKAELKNWKWSAESDTLTVNVAAPAGGILVLNTPYLPFWQASSRDNKLEIWPANGFQMALTLPANTTEIQLRYNRPFPSDVVKKWLKL